jgi:hypothetical protein
MDAMNVKPRYPHRNDLCASLIVCKLPPRESGVVVEQLFDAPTRGQDARAVGWYETPDGVRITVVVDPSMPPDAWRLEHSAMGTLINGGQNMRRAAHG